METKIEEYKLSLVKLINESGFPLGLTELVLESVLISVKEAKRKSMEAELAAVKESAPSEIE